MQMNPFTVLGIVVVCCCVSSSVSMAFSKPTSEASAQPTSEAPAQSTSSALAPMPVSSGSGGTGAGSGGGAGGTTSTPSTSSGGTVAPVPSPVTSAQKTFTDMQTITRNVRVVPAQGSDGRTNAINDNTLVETWGKNVSGYTHIKVGSNIMKITFEGAYNFYGYFVDSSDNKLSSTPYPTTSNISSLTLGKLA